MYKLINILPENKESLQNYKNLLATISAKDFCEALNELRAIETNSHTRTKKRAIRTILDSLDKLDKLGFKISIEPKKRAIRTILDSLDKLDKLGFKISIEPKK